MLEFLDMYGGAIFLFVWIIGAIVFAYFNYRDGEKDDFDPVGKFVFTFFWPALILILPVAFISLLIEVAWYSFIEYMKDKFNGNGG